ncbi:MAG: hypothetical protein KF819_25595 [Labilithrix sp.]|nr:hypothetical protein [Labilithrix sp.]
MQFRFGSIPIRIRVQFLFMAVLLGGANAREPQKLGIWAAVVFVSVLVHELGHAFVGRAFGLSPQIELHMMGGTTSWQEPRDVGNGRSIAISLAGPFAGFILGGATLVASQLIQPGHALADHAIKSLLWVNIGWGIINLVPMLPLDGGNVMRSALHIFTGGRGEKPARVVSAIIAGCVLALATLFGQIWIGVLAGLFAYINVQALRQADTRAADAPLAVAIEAAYVALERHDGAQAIALLRPALSPRASSDLRAIALRIYAYALLIEGEWAELLPLLAAERTLIGPEELSRYAKTARELGRADDATRIDALVLRPRPANDFG